VCENLAGLAEHHTREAEGFCAEEQLRRRLFASDKINGRAYTIWPLL
jgi:hypothetical protein